VSRVIIGHDELKERGFRALTDALGWPNAVRFLREYDAGAGDYTAERKSLLPDWPTARLVDEIARIQEEHEKKPGS
jgi:hypothetical protein